MKLVLDASVAVRWVTPSPLAPKAIRLRDEYQHRVHELIAPSIFSAEVASALTKAERQKLISVGDSLRLLPDVMQTLPGLHSFGALLYRAAEISSQTRSGLYDCLYVALAERENCEMVTADDKLVRNLGSQFPFITPLSSFP
jgi:predicted nucleic acid-binding protein